MKQLTTLLIGLVLTVQSICSFAQGYPSKPVRIIVPYVPGGTVDLVARVLAQQLTEQTGQPFIVENRAGASGVIGSDVVAKAAPDGYTLLVQSPTLIASPLMLKKIPYDVMRDFTPISQLGTVPMVLVINSASRPTNLREFITYVGDNTKKFNFGTSALGSPMHLATESIKHSAKLTVPVVPYRGTAAALNDLLGGQIDAIIDAAPSTMPHIVSGKLRPLAVTSKRRLPNLPNVPTLAESGFPEFEMVSWYGLWGPANMPDNMAKKLAVLTASAMTSKAVKDQLGSQGFMADMTNGDAFSRFLTKQLAKYRQVV